MDELLVAFEKNLFSLIPQIRDITLIAAVSGGKDSTALLCLLKAIESRAGFHLKAAYFNHHLRPDSQEEEEWVARFCRNRQVPLIIGGADVARHARQEHMNLEEAASQLRHAFLEPLARRTPSTRIVTGHTLSDLSETFLMRLFRGSGSLGLAAIHPRKHSRLIRPLLPFTENEIRGYLDRNGIPHYSDSSNQNETFLRNRMRRRLLPPLREAFPHLDHRILDTARILREEAEFMMETARHHMQRLLLLDRILPLHAVQALHPALQRHLLREYIRNLRGNLRGISFSHIESLRMPESPRRNLSIPGLTLSLRKGFLFPASFRLQEYTHILPAQGTLEIPEIRALVFIGSAPRKGPAQAEFSVCIDPARLSLPLRVRNARPSDRYRISAAGVPQRVFEMIRVAGLPAPLRGLRPLFCDASDQPFWLPGSPPASQAPVAGEKGLVLSVTGIRWKTVDQASNS